MHESSIDLLSGEKRTGAPCKALDDLKELVRREALSRGKSVVQLEFIHAKLSVFGADEVLMSQVRQLHLPLNAT